MKDQKGTWWFSALMVTCALGHLEIVKIPNKTKSVLRISWTAFGVSVGLCWIMLMPWWLMSTSNEKINIEDNPSGLTRRSASRFWFESPAKAWALRGQIFKGSKTNPPYPCLVFAVFGDCAMVYLAKHPARLVIIDNLVWDWSMTINFYVKTLIWYIYNEAWSAWRAHHEGHPSSIMTCAGGFLKSSCEKSQMLSLFFPFQKLQCQPLRFGGISARALTFLRQLASDEKKELEDAGGKGSRMRLITNATKELVISSTCFSHLVKNLANVDAAPPSL